MPKRKPANLTPAQERYAQARARGLDILPAYKEAGYRWSPTDFPSALLNRAKKIEATEWVAQRIDILKQKFGLQVEGERVAAHVTKAAGFDPQSVDKEWINRQAYEVHLAALDVDDFGAALRSLEFIGKLNGIIDHPRSPIGRPPNQRNPNEGDTRGTYKDDLVDDGGPGEGSGFDSFLDGLESEVGGQPSEGDDFIGCDEAEPAATGGTAGSAGPKESVGSPARQHGKDGGAVPSSTRS